MASPLTRQTRPDAFEPKIADLYRHLFHHTTNDDLDEILPSEGFWRELFLLKPDKQRLHDTLEPLTAADVLQIQARTHLFFQRTIEEAGCGVSPRNQNALENLAGFLSAVLTKRYTNPSTDTIEVLAGLDTIDRLVSDLVQGLETILRQSANAEFRHIAVATALTMVACSYQTSLITYCMHRDLFPALVKYAHEATEPVPEVLVLLGLLANYNKFESRNLYHSRLEDYVNTPTIADLVDSLIGVCHGIRDDYLRIQDDGPAPWTISSTLSMVGLRALTPEAKKPPPPTEDEAKARFALLPAANASILLAAYSFVQANNIFATQLTATSASTAADHAESPFASFLSATSYLCHHAHRSVRALHYAELSLLIVRVLVEEPATVKRLSSSDAKSPFRLARQRPPLLPLSTSSRIPITAVLDVLTDTLSHNLRKRLSLSLYNLTLTTLHRLLTHLDTTRTRLQHHWSYIWLSLCSLLRFLSQYAVDLTTPTSQLYAIRSDVCTPLTSLLAFCLSRGDNFLPDPSSYDDLYYKLIELAAVLPKFRDAYCARPSGPTSHGKKPGGSTAAAAAAAAATSMPATDILTLSTNALIKITSHYQTLLQSKGKGSQGTHQSPRAVQEIIKEGYDTMPDINSAHAVASSSPGSTLGGVGTVDGMPSIEPGMGGRGVLDFGYYERWRETSWKVEIKKILRTVVEDARLVALKS